MRSLPILWLVAIIFYAELCLLLVMRREIRWSCYHIVRRIRCWWWVTIAHRKADKLWYWLLVQNIVFIVCTIVVMKLLIRSILVLLISSILVGQYLLMALCKVAIVIITIDVTAILIILGWVLIVLKWVLIILGWVLISSHIPNVVFRESDKSAINKLQVYHLMAIVNEELVKIRYVAYPEIEDKA